MNTQPQEAPTNLAATDMESAIDDHIAARNAPVQDKAPQAVSEAPAEHEAPAPAQSEEAPEGQPEPEPTVEETGAPEPQPEGGEFDWQNLMIPVADDQEVTAEELRKSYLRQSDYTRKTQEVAEQRKEVEAQFAQIAQQQEQYLRGLEQMSAALQAQEPPVPDPSMQEYDPMGYLEAKEARRDYEERQAGLQQHYQEEMQQRQQMVMAQRTEFLQHNAQQLQQARPDLDTPEKMQAYGEANRKFLMEERGFTAEEANSVVDWRHAEIVDMARRYMLSQKTTKTKVREVQKQQKTPYIRQSQTKTATTTTAASEAKAADKRLTEEGTVDAAVDAILARRRAATN